MPKKNATRCLNGYTKEARPHAASNLSLSVMASLVCVLLFQVMFTETYIILLLQRVLTIFFSFLPIFVVSGLIKVFVAILHAGYH